MTVALFEAFDPNRPGWSAAFSEPRAEHVAWRVRDVLPVLREADRAAQAGRWAAVFVTYEASPAFDASLATHGRGQLPLAWVGVFDGPTAEAVASGPRRYAVGRWVPVVDRERYAAGFAIIREHIAAGNTYQVNYAFPLEASFGGDARAWYSDLCRVQQAAYCAYVELGPYRILSLSPELFVERRGCHLRARPMKGTSPRGRWLAEDEARARALVESEKARAENVMIVDLLRNDLGRLAAPGGVCVPQLFTPERYPTLWQLTSTVEAGCESPPPLVDVLQALFPCGSITGAPKVRTMGIVCEVEPFPRGIYTGTLGFVRPGGDFTLNVAIRTVLVDTVSGLTTCGVGGGVTADSSVEGEYEECLLKARFLREDTSDFALLETLRLEEGGLTLVDRHLDRMAESARYFGFAWQRTTALDALEACRRQHPTGRWRVRLLAARTGSVTTEAARLDDEPGRAWRLAVALAPVDDGDCWLFHKTTRREVYDRARAARPDADDVVLWNARGEVTETTMANLVVRLKGRLWTPPRTSGLLAGTFRAALLDEGTIAERPIAIGDLAAAEEVFLVNSVRGWWRGALVS